MYQVTVLTTGVAGAPYYQRAYFDATVGSAQQAADAWFTFCGDFDDEIPNGVTKELEPAVPTIDPVTGEITAVNIVTGDPVTGNVTGARMAPATQGLMRWRTNVFNSGREVRGRTNLPVVLQADSDTEGKPDVGYIGFWNSKAGALIADEDSTLVVYSKKNGLWAAVVTADMWSNYGVLRSRRD